LKIFGIVGWSGAGKTTLILALLSELTGRGLRVSTIKHTHHSVDLDRPGKDTWRHRNAGATEVVLLSSSRWTLMHELRDEREPEPQELISRMAPVDLLLTEGFKRSAIDKLEVFRPGLGKPAMYPFDQRIIAVASDAPLGDASVGEATVPVLPLADPAAIAAFIVRHCDLGGTAA